jgi:osmoprotectant transport system ATP-binding protein
MITLERVSKVFGNTKAVDDISFSVVEGETVVLLGTSGCGKTTTLRMINRLIEPSAGNIFVDGHDIEAQSPETLRRAIGYVLQHHGLFPHYSIAENISIVPRLLKWDKQKIENRVCELLEKLRLPLSVARLYPDKLSGGQQQRVGLARALAGNPPVLLMDEPLGALDPVTRAGIRKEFLHLDELKKKTIIMVTHDVQEAFELGDRICLMDKGKIIQIGSAGELLFNPANELVSAFLKEHQFQLKLQWTRIVDVWSQLPKAVDGVDERQLLPGDSLWYAIETISAQPSSLEQRFVCLENHEKKQIDIASLMAAYSGIKNYTRHE